MCTKVNPLLLGTQVKEQVQTYLKKIREQGGDVSASIVASIVAAASKGILLSIDWTQLAEFGGHIHLNRGWAYKLLH